MTTLLADVKFHISSAPFSGGLGYLAVVLALHRAMAHRKTPVSIPKGVLVLYNVVQVVVNAYVAYVIAHAVGGWVFGLGVRESPAVRHGVYLHYLCKYLDMFDTVIIALRKKSEQLSFLHLYHHSTIVVVWGWVVHTWPAEGSSAVYSYGAWINSVVHVVMYFYYGLTAVGIRPPFKKAVTIFQLSQFGSCIVHAIAVLLLDTTPGIYNAMQVCYHISMLYLFLPLLLHGNKGQRAAAEAELHGHGTQNGHARQNGHGGQYGYAEAGAVAQTPPTKRAMTSGWGMCFGAALDSFKKD
eukprot:Transcript_8160.p1 GENE.Transcript_8160~~Transcript_8160.p1  ORF type:complete len:297 (+),score=105.89 Transcript_8160:2-892(+)